MTETDPEDTSQEPPAQVPDDREDAAGPDAPAGIDPDGPAPHLPDDRKGAPGARTSGRGPDRPERS